MHRSIVALTSVVLLAACGGGAPPDSKTPETTGTSSATPPPSAAPTTPAPTAADAPLPLGQPLSGWFEFASLRRDLDGLSGEQGQAFLNRYRDQVVAQVFREAWLGVLAKREDWPSFRAAWSSTIKSTALRCAELNARQALGIIDAAWTADAQALWRSTGRSLPDACDAPMAVLAAKGKMVSAD